MPLLYITADSIGETSGGGLVTVQELQALRELSREATEVRRDASLSQVRVLSREQLNSAREEPWKWDEEAVQRLPNGPRPRLAHLYSGTFTKTVRGLWRDSCKVCYTIAAHDKEVSRREHEAMGLPFLYPHLVEPVLWKRYIEGYRLADVIVCPSSVAADTVRRYGPDFEKKDIRVIPHGADVPEEVKSLPSNFIVGYMGSYGADKGVRYLLEAWKKLGYSDGSLLVLAGKDSLTSGRYLLERYGGGAVHLAGWQKDVGDFYNSISLYCQPSVTEGFGCEVTEALAFGRMALVSEGAGAQDCVSWRFKAGSAADLASALDYQKTKGQAHLISNGRFAREELAPRYTWEKVRSQYKGLWAELLGWKN